MGFKEREMKTKYIIASLLIVNSLFALEDLGLHGKVEPIEGKSLMDVINENYEKVDKDELKKEVLDARAKSFKVENGLPTCEKTTQREYEPIITIDRDIEVPYMNATLFKKGYKYNILKEQNITFPYYLAFINIEDQVQISLANQLKDSSYLMIAQGDIGPYIEDGQDIKIARKEFEIKSFNIKCLPSIVTQKDFKFIINEYNPEDLIEDNKQ